MRRHLIVLLLFLTVLWTGSIQSQGTGDEKVIEIEMAIGAASKYLPTFYKKSDWTYYTHFTYYDLDNNPIAYAIVFRKLDSEVKSIEKMRETMEKNYLEIKSLNERIEVLHDNSQISGKEKNQSIMELHKKINRLKDSIRGVDRLATVITGALNTLPVVLKCHKGMPETFYKELDAREKLSKELPGLRFNISNVFYLGLFDIFYELTVTGGSLTAGSMTSISEEGMLFHLRTGKLVSLHEIRTKLEEQKSEKKSDSKRIQKNKERWERHKKMDKAGEKNLNVSRDSISQEKAYLNKIEVVRTSQESKETENPQRLPKKEKAPDKKEKKVKPESKKNDALPEPTKVKESKEEKK
jgi:hypothetical protein